MGRWSYLLAVVLLLVAAWLRLWQLATLPPGFSQPEYATLSIVDDSIRAGRISLFYTTGSEAALREGLHPTLSALVGLFAGDGMLSHRLLSVWAGMITLALTYSLGVRLMGPLAGLCALGLLAVLMSAIVLSRTLTVHALLPMLVAATLLMLARGFPVYRRQRDENTSTLTFATVGVLLGLGFYLHPIALMLVLIFAAFVLYLALSARPLLPRLSYIGFTCLMLLIITMPYMVYSINRPEAAPGLRVIGDYGGFFSTLAAGLGGLFFQGDLNAAHNLPGRPLMDLISGLLLLIGLLVCLRHWRQPRFALLLLTLAALALPALLTTGSPDFFAFAPLLPALAVLFGTGVASLVESARRRPVRWLLLAGLPALLAFNLVWVSRDLFGHWADDAAMHTAYQAREGRLAHYLDTTAGHIPSVLCDPVLAADAAAADNLLTAAGRILRLMNRKDAGIRLVDCRNALVFVEGGAPQQWILTEPGLLSRMNPYIRGWIGRGQPVQPAGLPPDAIIQIDAQRPLADNVGRFSTTAPARFISADVPEETTLPPVRLGENLTWLGYDPVDTNRYRPGDVMTIVTYWRVDGPLPDGLLFFFHILSDPVTVVRQRDTGPVQTASLRDRDVLVQTTAIDLAGTMLPGEYTVSAGAYRQQPDGSQRLPVFDTAGQPRGNRLLLYPILVALP
ncbi:MAG: glycosyltransferase family 39 protein [Anaerolineae bacterium]|nr:glycosyltransferase family 39 protein [Anaerolineae bacterium]